MNRPGNTIEKICSSLSNNGFSVKFRGFNAIDKYLGMPALPFFNIETSADLANLARHTENLRFPGMELADAAVDTSDGSCYFHCLERDEQNPYSFPLLSFAYDWQTRRFQDLFGVYPMLRKLKRKDKFSVIKGSSINKAGRNKPLMDIALLLARYDFETNVKALAASFAEALDDNLKEPVPGPEAQKIFLVCLLLSPHPERGLEFLKHTTFLKEIWPELASLDDVDHSKEYHPEGNVWDHTLETFRYRKAYGSGAFDLRLSLGLLVHDMGKPISASFGNRRFDGHAELGAHAVTKFLRRLEFEPDLVQDIYYLVRHHMLPAALKRLPLTKTAEIMSSPLFPTLMELYRCDESSSFKGLNGYYENSAAYKAYLKNQKNPYRSADGKKMKKAEISLSHGRR